MQDFTKYWELAICIQYTDSMHQTAVGCPPYSRIPGLFKSKHSRPQFSSLELTTWACGVFPPRHEEPPATVSELTWRPSDPSPTSCCVQLLLAWLVPGKPQVASLLPENKPPRCPPVSAWEVGIFGGCYGQKGSCFWTQVFRSTAEIESRMPHPLLETPGPLPRRLIPASITTLQRHS